MGHVPHLYVPGPWDGPALTLGVDQVNHLTRVLRRGNDAPLSYTDGAGVVGEGVFADGGIERGDERAIPAPPAIRIAVAPPRSSDRCRWIVEKLQELAVETLIWITTNHGEGRPPKPDKALAWAVGALEQSRGSHLMGIETAGELKNLEGPLAVADQSGGPLEVVTPTVSLTVAIGPEGGWAPGEIPTGATVISLADTVLRTETAAIAAAVAVRTFSGSERR
jgi:RsmE family RNA methyltransferase